MTMKYFAILFVFLSISCVNEKSSDLESDKLIDSFFDSYKDKGIETALNEIFATNMFFSKHYSSVDEVKNSLISSANSMGKYCGHEVVSKCVIGKSVIHYTCVVKYEIQPMRFMFTLYKPQEAWILFNFQFSTEFTNELNDSAKFFYIE